MSRLIVWPRGEVVKASATLTRRAAMLYNAPRMPGPLRRGTGLPKNAVVAAVCLVAIGASVYLLARPTGTRGDVNLADYHRPWVCEACGHTSRALPGPGKRRCPQCGDDKAVQSIVFVCGKCGEEFEAYRRLDNYDTDATPGKGGKLVLPLPHFRKPGGEWTPDRTKLGPIRCPACGSDDAATLTEKTFGPARK